ncbi:MAG: HU family DNA-binding protein [Spirochaetaceae bacterium]|jgi:integration host factor subunit beta|nr:HU family DNA-binding protein [Spirochaetaceae bacterium]
MSAEKFTKAEIIDAVYEKVDMTRSDIKFVLDIILTSIKDALCAGKTAELRGFGTFEICLRKGRSKARNPRTGEPAMAFPHGVVKFRPGKEMKQAVWSNGQSDSGEDSPEKETSAGLM